MPILRSSFAAAAEIPAKTAARNWTLVEDSCRYRTTTPARAGIQLAIRLPTACSIAKKSSLF
jgi:hypothetical protein